MSAAGDALQMLPASVARFRIWTEPTTAAASASAGKCRRTSGSAATSVITVVAPMTTRPSDLADAGPELGDPLDVDHDGRRGRPVAEPDDQVRASGQDAGVRTVGVEERDRLGQGRGPGVGEGVHDDRPSLRYRILSTSSRRTWGVAARMKKNGRSQKRFTKSARFARRTSLSTIGMTWPGASSSLVRK